MTAIRDAATESEAVVREITRDIQSLDLAKRNLVASMNALKRFQMLGELFWTASPPWTPRDQIRDPGLLTLPACPRSHSSRL